MSIELYVLSEHDCLDSDGMNSVTIGVGAENGAAGARMATPDGKPLNLVFRALFREDRDAAEWESRIRHELEKSGVKVGSEFFFVSESMVESLCNVAAHAEQYEWLIPPPDAEYAELATKLGRAKRDVDAAFDRWSACGRTPSAEIKINSYTQHIARNEKRIRELRGKYLKPRFYNDGEKSNARIDYAISRLNEESRKWRSEIKRLRGQIEESELAFADWQAAVRRVNELEGEIARRSAANPSS